MKFIIQLKSKQPINIEQVNQVVNPCKKNRLTCHPKTKYFKKLDTNSAFLVFDCNMITLNDVNLFMNIINNDYNSIVSAGYDDEIDELCPCIMHTLEQYAHDRAINLHERKIYDLLYKSFDAIRTSVHKRDANQSTLIDAINKYKDIIESHEFQALNQTKRGHKLMNQIISVFGFISLCVITLGIAPIAYLAIKAFDPSLPPLSSFIESEQDKSDDEKKINTRLGTFFSKVYPSDADELSQTQPSRDR